MSTQTKKQTRKVTLTPKEREKQRALEVRGKLKQLGGIRIDDYNVGTPITFYGCITGYETKTLGRMADGGTVEFRYTPFFSNVLLIEAIRKYCVAQDIAYVERDLQGEKLSRRDVNILRAQSRTLAQIADRLGAKV